MIYSISNLSYIYSDIMIIMIYGRRDFFSFNLEHNLKEGDGKKLGKTICSLNLNF